MMKCGVIRLFLIEAILQDNLINVLYLQCNCQIWSFFERYLRFHFWTATIMPVRPVFINDSYYVRNDVRYICIIIGWWNIFVSRKSVSSKLSDFQVCRPREIGFAFHRADKQVERSEIPPCGGRCCFAIVAYAEGHLTQ